MKNTWLAVLMFALGILSISACSTNKQITPAQETASPNATVIPNSAVATSQSQTQESNKATNDDTLSLDSRTAGLDKLKSYHITWKSQWSATDNGKTQNVTWDWSEEFSSDPDSLHWTWKTIGTEDTNQNNMEAWQIGEMTYMLMAGQDGKPTCVSYSTQDPTQRISKGLFSPQLLGKLSGARLVGNETVNGVAAKHYQYDEKASTLAGFGKVAGDVWIATDGGYVVKDALKWQGGAGIFGATETSTGEGQWAWELTDANKPITIKPPENCGGATSDLPILPDAKEKTTMGDTIIYKTVTPTADVVNFYKKEMNTAGWKLEDEPTTAEGFASLSFTKDTQKAQVNITTDQNETTVMINLTK